MAGKKEQLDLKKVHEFREGYVDKITDVITEGEYARQSTREELYGLVCALFQVVVPLAKGLAMDVVDAAGLLKTIWGASRPAPWVKHLGIEN